MKPKIYIETSFISYLVSKSNRDIVILANQEVTKEWWLKYRNNFELYISSYVFDEISLGDIELSKRRLEIALELNLLSDSEEVINLAEKIYFQKIFPQKAANDVLHISSAIIHKMDFLLTWNCKHIANPFFLKELQKIINKLEYNLPIICTPQEILGGSNE